jgi:hypothetical protein
LLTVMTISPTVGFHFGCALTVIVFHLAARPRT